MKATMNGSIAHVRRKVMLLASVAFILGALVMVLITPLILFQDSRSVLTTWVFYIVLAPPLLMVILVAIHFYLDPIAKLAKLQSVGDAIPPELLVKTRIRAFRASIYFLVMPVALVFLVASLGDLFGLLFVKDYIFIQRYLGTLLITVLAACFSLVVSVVSRRLLTPVLLFTSGLVEIKGPRFDLSIRQFFITFLLTFIAIVFLGVLGYNALFQSTRLGLQERYRLLAESIVNQLPTYLDMDLLVDYVETLQPDQGEVFILNVQTGSMVTEISPDYAPLTPMGGTLAARILNAPEDVRQLEPLLALDGEILLVDLNYPDNTWWLGIYYRVRPFEVPIVRRSAAVLLGFAIGMFVLIFATNRYLSEDLTRDIKYVTLRLDELARGNVTNLEKVHVLSLDEVGDLVLAFNTLLDRVQEQRSYMVREQAELRALLEVSRDIGFILDEKQLLHQVISSLEGSFDYRNLVIFLLDDAAPSLRVAAHSEHLSFDEGARWPLDEGTLVGRSILTGTAVLVNNENTYGSYLPLKARSELVVPMMRSGQPVGAFNLGEETPYALLEEDLRILTAIANQTSVALHNARLYREVEMRREMAATLVRLAKFVNSTLDLNQVLNVALEQLAQVIPYDSSAILLTQGDVLMIKAGRGFENPELVVGSVIHPEEKNVGYQVMLQQSMRIVDDVQTLPDWGHDRDDIEGASTIRSWIGAPLVIQGRSLGLLTLDKKEPKFYTLEHGRLAAAFAEQIAVAVQNARLYSTAQERATELALLHEISQRISSLLDIDELLDEIVQRVSATFGYQVVSIHLLNERTNELTFAAQHGMDESFIDRSRIDVDERGIVPWVASHRHPLLVSDVTQDERYVPVAPGVRSELAIPLRTAGRVVGVFNLESQRVNAFDDDDVRLMTALAHQITVVLENARLFQSVRRQARQLELIQEISQKINSILDIDQLLDEVSRTVSSTFGYQHVAIFLVDEAKHELYFGAQVGYPPDVVEMRLPIYGNRGVVAAVAATCEPILVSDVQEDPRYIPALDSVKSELAIPMVIGENLVGVFNLESDSLNAFDEADTQLMMTLGQQITVALENARLFESVRDQALELAHMANNLSEEKSKLDAILRNIADGLLVTDNQGRIIRANPAFEQMFDRSSDMLLGRSLRRAITEDEMLQLVSRALQERTATFSSEIPMTDGRTLKASSAAIQENGRSLGVVTVVRDVTYEKAVDRMKTEFISTVSHELRTPLTSVLGFAKLIGRAFERDIIPYLNLEQGRAKRAVHRVRSNLDIIVVEGERLTRLINDVLDISKMESGKVEWHDQLFSLEEHIKPIVDSVRALARKKNLKLQVEVSESLPSLVADPDRIHQVLVNLISNAVKFTEIGEIVVRARNLSPGEFVNGWQVPDVGGVLVAVQDTGVGIPDNALPNLFHRFQQVVSDTLTDKPKGTGLGLAICREIVLHYGGAIWVESVLHEGSTFYFTLPLRPVDGSFQRSPVTEARRWQKNGLDVRNTESIPLILLVDDEPHVRSVLGQELNSAGYQVVMSGKGLEAITLARHLVPRPALILLDVMLPDISGFDVLRILKGDRVTASIPILVLSVVDDREHGLALGADEYLIKPVETANLLDAVDRLVTYPESQKDSAETPTQLFETSVLPALTDLLHTREFEVTDIYQNVRIPSEKTGDLVEQLQGLNVSEALCFYGKASGERLILIVTKALDDGDLQ